ncbi:MAG: MFS transporter [Gammaproteobacteria bacterium]|nr:MFS transporter [Gammaproteobacteria bacterium]
MQRDQINFIFLNIGHFLDHFFMLIFASVAALHLTIEWHKNYSELIPYATPGFIAFGLLALVAGWLADRWNRRWMMLIFFIGIGMSSILSSLANSPLQMAIGLLFIGVFAAIYHPVGLAMVTDGQKKRGIRLAINGVFGNMGVACAALLTGVLIDYYGWRSAFFIPGTLSICIGLLYLFFIWHEPKIKNNLHLNEKKIIHRKEPIPRAMLIQIFSIIFFTTAIGGFIFQSTTFSLPKVFEEVLSGSASIIGWYAFLVFSFAALAQLIVGYLLDNRPIGTVFSVVAFMQMVLFIMMTQASGINALITALGFMLFVFGQIPINDVLISRITKSEYRSRAYAARYIVTFTVMALSIPLIAWIHGQWGFKILFTCLAASAFMIFVATLFIPKNSKDLLESFHG